MFESRFEISTVVVGDGQEKEEVRETKVLNRIIRMDNDGWHYEADHRQGELIVKALNLQEAKLVQTPGEDEKSWQEEEDRELLEQPRTRASIGPLAARANYLALDLLDIQYAVQEMCREMSNPTRGDFPSTAEAWELLRRALPQRLVLRVPGRPRSQPATPTPTGLASRRQPGARAVGLSSGDDTPSRHGPSPRKT